MMLLLLLIFALGHPRITSCNSRVTSRSGQKHCQGWWWDDAALTSQFYQGLKDNVKDDIGRGEKAVGKGEAGSPATGGTEAAGGDKPRAANRCAATAAIPDDMTRGCCGGIAWYESLAPQGSVQ